MKYVFCVIKNILILIIAIAILRKASNDYEKILFSILLLIYITIVLIVGWLQVFMGSFITLLIKEIEIIKKLLLEKNSLKTILTSNEVEDAKYKAWVHGGSSEFEMEVNKNKPKMIINFSFKIIILVISLWYLAIGLNLF